MKPRVHVPFEDSETQEAPFTTREVRAAELEITRGPDLGQRRRFEEPSLLVGKGASAGWRLTDQTVSREQLRLELASDGILIHDGGSKNGTWLGGIRVHKVLVTQDVAVRLGATTISIQLDAANSSLLLSNAPQFGGAFGQSTAMRHVFASLMRASSSDVTVLMEGESGVGKEVLARALHEHSSRNHKPFITVDCGAIAPNLIESELFGHEKGSFTGATHTRQGLFQQADGGTIFLDELGELPIDLQPKLLRVLEQREVRPIGATGFRRVDVRVIAATNRVLTDRIKDGTFREDLFYRLAVVRVRVPALRERSEDIPLLANRFLCEITGDATAALPDDVLTMLSAYNWPGNVRELRNAVTRFGVLNVRNRAELLDITQQLQRNSATRPEEDLSTLSYFDARQHVLEQLESSYFPAVLKRAGGVMSHAAELSGMSRSSFYRMLERLGRRPEGFDPEE